MLQKEVVFKSLLQFKFFISKRYLLCPKKPLYGVEGGKGAPKEVNDNLFHFGSFKVCSAILGKFYT